MINRSLGGKAPLFLLIFFLGATAGLYAQDPRVSQYQAIPLLVSPAQTGDFDGKMRITGLYARVDNDLAHNNFFNSSVDWRLGQKGRWGLGLNYFQSGSAKVPMVGKNLGISGTHLSPGAPGGRQLTVFRYSQLFKL